MHSKQNNKDLSWQNIAFETINNAMRKCFTHTSKLCELVQCISVSLNGLSSSPFCSLWIKFSWGPVRIKEWGGLLLCTSISLNRELE